MDNICRTCMRTSKKLINLERDDSLKEKIFVLSSIQITLDEDIIPKGICNECEDNLNKFYCFRKVIINTDKELKERMNNYLKINSVKIKEEDVCKSEDIFFDENDDDPNDSFVDEDGCDEIESNSEKQSKKGPRTCSDCNVVFPSSADLWKHKRKNHVKPGICNICGVVVRADNLKKHVRIHYQDSVSCKICNKKYKNAESLRSHLLIHKGLEFKCDICGKVSAVKSEHHRHMKSHKDPNIRKVICTICGKRMKDLKRHMLSHTGERPYPCTYCSKGFTSSYALKVHTRQHTNEKPFICEYCSMGFKQKCSLITHLKSKHDRETK